MAQLDTVILTLVQRAVKRGAKVSVFDNVGRLLWFSEDWMEAGGPMENPTEALGWRWLEFIHPADIARTNAWIADGEGAELHCRCLCGTAAAQWLHISMRKRRAGDYWVAIGANHLADEDDNDAADAPEDDDIGGEM